MSPGKLGVPSLKKAIDGLRLARQISDEPLMFQIFLVESLMDSILFVQAEGPRFPSYGEALSFYKEGRYGEKSQGSTEDHVEYQILEIKDRKLFRTGASLPLRRDTLTKEGDFVLLREQDGTDRVCVETINGIEQLTWRDR